MLVYSNILITKPSQGVSLFYTLTSDEATSYPRVLDSILKRYEGTADVLQRLRLKPGHVKCFHYKFELNLDEGTFKVWDSSSYWVNAKKEKGDTCWVGDNYKSGYESYRKHRILNHFESTKIYKGEIHILPDTRYNWQHFKALDDSEYLHFLHQYIRKLKYHPYLVHTWLDACPDYYSLFYERPLEDMALEINSDHTLTQSVAKYRLKISV